MIELSMAFCFVIRGLVPSRITDVHWITLSGVLCIERTAFPVLEIHIDTFLLFNSFVGVPTYTPFSS